MTSQLVVEDGSGNPDANSYVSAEDLRAYASLRGVILAASNDEGDALVDQMAIKAMDYIEAQRAKYAGIRLTSEQRLSFPRKGVPGIVTGETTIGDGFRPPAPIPDELIEAQCQLTMQVKNGVNLNPVQPSGPLLIKQKIGPIERQYSEAVALYQYPVMPTVDALLTPLFAVTMGGGQFSVYRR